MRETSPGVSARPVLRGQKGCACAGTTAVKFPKKIQIFDSSYSLLFSKLDTRDLCSANKCFHGNCGAAQCPENEIGSCKQSKGVCLVEEFLKVLAWSMS